MRTISLWALITLALIGSVSIAVAQYRPPLTVLQTADASVTGREVVVATFDADPGTAEGLHTHPGEMVGYVIGGAIRLERPGQAPEIMASGESFIIPAGMPHRTLNTGTTQAEMVVVYFVDKDKARSAPAFPSN